MSVGSVSCSQVFLNSGEPPKGDAYSRTNHGILARNGAESNSQKTWSGEYKWSSKEPSMAGAFKKG